MARPLALALALLLPTVAIAEPWPAKGRCFPPWPNKPASACIQVSPGDARTIQKLMIATAEKRGNKKAKAFAQRPITDGFIGPFAIYGYQFSDYKGDTLELVAVESTESGTETGFKFVVGRDTPKSPWKLLHFQHYRKQLPQVD
jgi:hypothetical protein